MVFMVVVPALSGRLLAGADIKSNIHAIDLRCHARKTPFIGGSNAALDISQAWTSPQLPARGAGRPARLILSPGSFTPVPGFQTKAGCPTQETKESRTPANPDL